MRVAIVGNGPVEPGAGSIIDGSDLVVRFNEPPHDQGAGTRTDMLFVVNSGKTMQHRLTDPAYIASPVFISAGRIVLPYHPSVITRYHPKPNLLSRAKGRKADWTAEAISVFGMAGKEVTILPLSFYDECCGELAIAPADRTRIFPSTGFVGIRYCLAKFPPPDNEIRLFGFGWQGWKRHAWDKERTWIEARLPNAVSS